MASARSWTSRSRRCRPASTTAPPRSCAWTTSRPSWPGWRRAASPSPLRTRDGTLRVIARGPTFGTLMDEAFDQIRQHSGGDVAVLARLVWALRFLSDLPIGSDRRRVLHDHAAALHEAILRTVPSPTERRGLDAAYDDLARHLG